MSESKTDTKAASGTSDEPNTPNTNVSKSDQAEAPGPEPTAPFLDAADPITEPITTRPVANRFDFVSPAMPEMIAEYQAAAPSRRFATLPATELHTVPPTQVSAIPSKQISAVRMASRDLANLRPETTLTAVAQQSTKAPQVAGWSLVRTIKTEELSQDHALVAHTPLVLPVKKPDIPQSYLAAPAPKVSQSKKSRRTVKRRRKKSSSKSALKKAKPKPVGGRSWESQALFRDN